MKGHISERVRREIIRFAKKYDLNQVILFGSRARGDHRERSDIDLATKGGDGDGFYWEVKENAHTLLLFDIINLDEGVSGDLLQEIARDGILLYSKL